MARLAKNFPPELTYEIPYDSSRFVEASFWEVVKTLIESIDCTRACHQLSQITVAAR
jgi:multidrug efflux pump subunit AcrB